MTYEIKKVGCSLDESSKSRKFDLAWPTENKEKELPKARVQSPSTSLVDLKTNPSRSSFEIASDPILSVLRANDPFEKKKRYGEAFKTLGTRLILMGENNPKPTEEATRCLWQLERVRQKYREDFPNEKGFPL